MEPVENIRQLEKSQAEAFIRAIEALPLLSPREIYARLEELGYRGQEAPRRAISLMAYRHVRRLRRLHLEKIDREAILPKTNYLLVGPTGCGKTHLVELLFGKILKLPTVVVDVTTYSETGYVGQDPNTILTRLLYAADSNPLLAQIGIVCLDEFDKLSSGQNNAVFAGAGTTKDVTGLGVQRELLKMLESSEVVVPLELSHSTFGEFMVLSTADIGFIAVGAFSGLPQIIRRRGLGGSLGFGRSSRAGGALQDDAIAVSLTPDEVEGIAHFQAYGFLPELISRFTRIVPFAALDTVTLKAILLDSVIQRMKMEFEEEGLELQLGAEVLDWVVAKSVQRQTGARGLHAILTRALEEIAFDTFAGEKRGAVRLAVEEDRVVVSRGGRGRPR